MSRLLPSPSSCCSPSPRPPPAPSPLSPLSPPIPLARLFLACIAWTRSALLVPNSGRAVCAACCSRARSGCHELVESPPVGVSGLGSRACLVETPRVSTAFVVRGALVLGLVSIAVAVSSRSERGSTPASACSCSVRVSWPFSSRVPRAIYHRGCPRHDGHWLLVLIHAPDVRSRSVAFSD